MPGPGGPARHVLIVEDDDPVREMLEEALGDAGYRPVAAEDGVEALDWLAQVPVDLIIVDILMPRLDGPGLIRRVRRTGRWATIPIVVLSAFANLDRFQDLPVQGFLLKPVELAQLVDKVRELIGPADRA